MPAALPERYARLADAFDRAGIAASKIYVTEYPDATRDARGLTCDPLIPYLDSRPFGYTVRGTITRAEAAEAEQELVVAVNDRAEGRGLDLRLAPRLGDRGAVGNARPVRERGRGSSGVYESLITQHDVLGTLHPNGQGQQASSCARRTRALKPALG